MTSTSGYQGIADLSSGQTAFNRAALQIRSMINKIATTELVEVMAVNGDTVDIKPMVSQVDGQGLGTDHGIIYGVPFFRLQGGNGGMMLDPVVGDIGAAIFCAHDISVVQSTRAPGLPGSRRRFDWADGLYLGGFLNDNPTRYVKMSSAGVELVDPEHVIVTSPQLNISGDLSVGGNLSVTGQTVLGSGATKFVMLADMTPATTVKAK